MIKTSITDDLREKYKQSFLENSDMINYTELTAKDGLITALYDDLPKNEINGYPIASDLVDGSGKIYSPSDLDGISEENRRNLKLRYHFLPNFHELYVGTTGSGKTTGCVEPQLRAISSIKNKPNLFITDPKGELFEHNARHLAENGYELFVMNFKDITHSHRWNPLLEIYEKKQESINIGKGLKNCNYPLNPDLILNAPKEEFVGKSYIEYNGRAFPDVKSLGYFLSFERDYLQAEVDYMVDQFACSMIKIKNRKDPSWEYGAQQLLKGIVHIMLEDSVKIDPKQRLTKDMMTLMTIQQYYLALRKDLLSDNYYSFFDHPLLKNKPKRITSMLAIAFNNAKNTMLSYCGVFDGAMKDWFQGHTFAMTTGCTVNIDNLDKPYAIFVITRDYEKSDFAIAGLFIDWVYKRALLKAENSPRRSDGLPDTRPLHFILDEFGNIPPIPNFENKISTSRSRNIWFHLVLQSYEQINLVYSPECATVIIDNCNSQIFLGAQSRKTKEKFSAECGKRWVPSLANYLAPRELGLFETDVIPISDLDLINPGEMFNKRLYKPVITSKFLRSYICGQLGIYKDYSDRFAYRDFTPINMESFYSDKYKFKLLESYDKNEDE